ncbi:MAG: hypothetical protein AAGN35_18625 [Bacteroidota bacterium]
MIRNSKLGYYLTRLSNKQKSAFRDFLASPYFNKKSEPRVLFEVLDQRMLRYKKASLQPEDAFAEVFPEQPFRKAVYRKLMNRLLNLLLQFLAHETLSRDEVAELRATHKAVSGIGADRYFDFLHKKVSDALDPNHIDHFDHAYEVESNLAELQAKKSLRSEFENFDRLITLMDHSYTVKRLQLGYYALTSSRVTGKVTKIPGLDQFLDELGDRIETQPLLIRMLYYRYMTLAQEGNPTHFHRLRSLLEEHAAGLSYDLAVELYEGILSHSIYRVNAGDPDFLPELLRVYQGMLRGGYLVDEDHLPAAHFKNIVVVAARAGELAWADWFVDQYGPQIKPDLRASALTYNQAVIDYFRQRFSPSEKGFQIITGDPQDLYYGVDARVYLLRIYYETGNFDGMDSLSHSFRVYLTRNRSLPAGRKEKYYTFLALYRRLMNIAPRDAERVRKLREDILASPRIAPRAWLLEKVQVLIQELPPRYH